MDYRRILEVDAPVDEVVSRELRMLLTILVAGLETLGAAGKANPKVTMR